MTTQGRPTLYDQEFCEQAHNYCLLGATNDDLAGFFHVSPSTIDNWIARHGEFAAAVKRGRVAADARVARCLFDRAVGFEQRTEREVLVRGELRTLSQTVQHPPNVQACIFWLRNRRPATWRVAGEGSAAGARVDPAADDWAAFDAAGERAKAEAEAKARAAAEAKGPSLRSG